jgi:drug/metabolite transporter (DMT)-like permease
VPDKSAAAQSSSSSSGGGSSVLGIMLIGMSATLWATDPLFRVPAVQSVSPVFIVLFEHIIGTALLGAWVFFRNRKEVTALSGTSWLSLFLIGAGGSAIATVLFTASFKHINPSVAILLQKLQPVMVVVFAALFLRERPSRGFWIWALVALVAAITVSFPDFNFSFLSQGIDFHSLGVIFALTAAALWALSTVAGKSVVNKHPPGVVTFWRYFFGLVTLIGLMLAGGESIPWDGMQDPKIWKSLLYIAFFPGISALVLYYNGLRRTTATTATFVELLFPISAVVLNWVFLHDPLIPTQIFAGIILLYSVAKIS